MRLQERFSHLSRREFNKISLSGFGWFFLESFGLAAGVEVAQRVEYEHKRLTFTNWPEEWNGAVFIQISDLHVGEDGVDLISPAKLEQIRHHIDEELQLVSENNQISITSAKTILFDTGDRVSIASLEHPAQTRWEDGQVGYEMLKSIPADHAFLIPGNHDEGHTKKYEFQELGHKLGFTLGGSINDDRFLINNSDLPFAVAMTPDYTNHSRWYGSPAYERLLQQLAMIGSSKPVFILTHNASAFDVWRQGEFPRTLRELGVEFVALSGHTHGGHFDRITPMQTILQGVALGRVGYGSRFVNGFYALPGNNLLHVSPGLGTTRPFRTVQSKITFFHVFKKTKVQADIAA